MVQIRTYNPPDYTSIKDILVKSNLYRDLSDRQEIIEREISRNRLEVLVATQRGDIVGTNFIQPGFMPCMFRLAVHPDHRNNKIGRKLLESAEARLCEQGYNHVSIMVLTSDEKLRDHYKKLGYEEAAPASRLTLLLTKA